MLILEDRYIGRLIKAVIGKTPVLTGRRPCTTGVLEQQSPILLSESDPSRLPCPNSISSGLLLSGSIPPEYDPWRSRKRAFRRDRRRIQLPGQRPPWPRPGKSRPGVSSFQFSCPGRTCHNEKRNSERHKKLLPACNKKPLAFYSIDRQYNFVSR